MWTLFCNDAAAGVMDTAHQDLDDIDNQLSHLNQNVEIDYDDHDPFGEEVQTNSSSSIANVLVIPDTSRSSFTEDDSLASYQTKFPDFG